MDEFGRLVEDTFKHFNENFNKMLIEEKSVPESLPQDQVNYFPEGPGVIYHLQKSSSVFVIRTLISKNVKQDYAIILERPEDYPTLRLLEEGAESIEKKLKFFMVESALEAEIIHDQLNNRRFPINEEMLCNLSDPGFSWWLTKKDKGFQLSFTMSVSSNDKTIKLGPLGDRELAIRNFQKLEQLINDSGIEMNIQNEMNRVQFTDCEEFILEELKDIFEFGVITETLQDLFRILSKKATDTSLLEESWFYLNELAAVRRFWIQISFDLNLDS